MPAITGIKAAIKKFTIKNMLGKLTEAQIEDLLKNQLIGRIGCHADGITYVVPVNYLYDGTYIYAHSGKGMKVEMMQKNPDICFEVDDIKNILDWQSVILWGKFEEITDLHEKEETLQKLIKRVVPFLTEEGHPSHGITANESDIGTEVELVLYKIIISKKTGRFEKH
ncbi:MAG TPA: pyridoxamine 5'-phosphate oxidase family protein [Mucilaginibacter sp.]